MNVEMAKISPKGQVVIPQRIRDELSIKAGNRFVVYTVDDSIVFRKLELTLESGIGSEGKHISI
jgi:AbrB family looped-hinge helix DNA binding protein